MHLRFAAPIAFAAASFGMAAVTAAAPDPAVKIAAPLTHENLTIYLVRGTSAEGPIPATLEEALAKGSVIVHETGNVRQLKIENTGGEPVFIQFGDLVKGGQQDRVLTTSLLIPPRSGQIAIGAYCVEQGRWSKRGIEDAKKFSASNAQLFSRSAKVAIAREPVAAPRPRPDLQLFALDGDRTEPQRNVAPQANQTPQAGVAQRLNRGSPSGASGQGAVWDSVKTAQASLAMRFAAPVASEKSQTSLQLTIENERLQKAQSAFVAAIEAKGALDNDVIGIVTAINGQLASADIYPSNGLLRKMWPKLLRAAAMEAIANPDKDKTAAPTIADVTTFLSAAESGEANTRTLGSIAQHETKESANVLKVEARTADGRWIHRNFLAAK